MLRRFLVPVFVTALTLGVAPRPSFAADGHFRCMYRCAERGFGPPGRHPGVRQWSWPGPAPRPATRPGPRRPCWLFCSDRGHGGWGHGGWGHAGWSHRTWSGPRWPRPDRWPGGRWDDRWDRDGGSGYDAHRTHPRGRDF